MHLQRRGKEKLERELVQTISVPKASLRWAKAGKEIWVNGHLFDVKSYTLKDNTYEFRGLFDEDETHVVNMLRKQGMQQSSTDNKLLSQLFNLLQSVYFETADHSLYAYCGPVLIFSENDQPPVSRLKLVITPPPRC